LQAGGKRLTAATRPLAGDWRITMRNRDDLIFARDEMIFVKELWKLILEAEELVRDRYMKLAEQEIYDLYDENVDGQPF
jgi:hypothetical protein